MLALTPLVLFMKEHGIKGAVIGFNEEGKVKADFSNTAIDKTIVPFHHLTAVRVSPGECAAFYAGGRQ